MNTIKSSLEEDNFDEDDQSYKVIQRRQSKRRQSDRRVSRPKLLTNSEIRKLRKIEPESIILLRMNHRRSEDRRVSAPKVLSVDEIQILRNN